jgi:hypothetical protein
MTPKTMSLPASMTKTRAQSAVMIEEIIVWGIKWNS